MSVEYFQRKGKLKLPYVSCKNKLYTGVHFVERWLLIRTKLFHKNHSYKILDNTAQSLSLSFMCNIKMNNIDITSQAIL